MERMLRKKKDNSEYEIDRELTGKFAIEKNAEYQEKIERLEQENKKLKEYNRRLKQGNDDLKEQNKKLKHENSYRAGIVDILPKGKGHIAEETIQDLQARINELKEIIKDHKLYEEKLEHRIIELEELLHGE